MGWKMGVGYVLEDGRVVSGRRNVDICKRGMRGVGRYGRWLEESGWHSNKLMCERRAECEASSLRWT